MNIEKFIKYFDDSSSICRNFGETTKGIKFNEETQAIELYALTSISMCAQHSKSISILLRENLFTDCFILSRNLIEVFFNLNWATKAETREAVLERVFRLEANPYNNFDKEIKLMEKSIDGNKPNLSKALILKHIEAINGEKNNFPFLLVNKNDFKSNFKSVPSLPERMGELRLLYYHLYRFSSMFTHPSPKLKEFFMHRITNHNEPTDAIIEPLKQILSYCLLFIELCFAITKDVLFNFNPEYNPDRQEMYNKLGSIVLESNEGYYNNPSNT
ncbi:MAG TPA: DUF5677 domain-containing protein [Ignavibacteriaceae bacterium]|nr:DUF5677 domain-containing protein [Ignavibacteriaceae bacterium]HRQ53191.1 DUF5677 domain-containing protein [Ignavibacteriaceae bacterium]